MKKLIFLFIIFTTLSKVMISQDAQFTQFNATQVYLNPAFSGQTDEHRFNAAYRNQWPGIKKTFTSYLISYDYNLENYNSGIGGYLLYDQAGSSSLSNTQLMLNYAYKLRLNDNYDLRCALQGGFHQRKYDFKKLVFTDQLITGSSISQDNMSAEPISYFDAGTGLLLYSKKMWFGVTARHLTQPNISLTGGSEALPLYIGAHGAYIHELAPADEGETKSSQSISALFNYRHQGVNDQTDIGVQYFHKILSAAVWYRGIPFKKYSSSLPNNESLAIILGYEPKGKGLRVAYSFDFTLSKLGAQNTYGAHEITIGYELNKGPARRKARPTISTPMKF